LALIRRIQAKARRMPTDDFVGEVRQEIDRSKTTARGRGARRFARPVSALASNGSLGRPLVRRRGPETPVRERVQYSVPIRIRARRRGWRGSFGRRHFFSLGGAGFGRPFLGRVPPERNCGDASANSNEVIAGAPCRPGQSRFLTNLKFFHILQVFV